MGGFKEGEGDTVDLTEGKEIDVTERPRQRWGQPGRCPQCSSPGYLDHIDMVDRLMYQHCTECAHKWTTAEAETASTSV